MILTGVVLLILSTVILSLVSLVIDKRIENLSESYSHSQKAKDEVEDSFKMNVIYGQNFHTHLNQFRVFQAINPQTDHLYPILESVVASKVQAAGGMLNALQKTEYIDQDDYDSLSKELSRPVDLSNNQPFAELDKTHQDIIARVQRGVFTLEEKVKRTGKQYASWKRIKSGALSLALLLNIGSLLVGANATIVDKQVSDQNLEEQFNEVQSRIDSLEVSLEKRADSITRLINQISTQNVK